MAYPVGLSSCPDFPHRFIFQYLKLRFVTSVIWALPALFKQRLRDRAIPNNAHGSRQKWLWQARLPWLGR
jgi:hypothetical protein